MSQGQVALGNSPVADVYAEELAAGELEVPFAARGGDRGAVINPRR